MKQALLTSILLFFITFAHAQKADTSAWEIKRTLSKAVSDNIGFLETDWLRVKDFDSVKQRYIVEKRFFKAIDSRDIQVQFRTSPVIWLQKKTAKQNLIDSLINTL